MLDQSVTVIRIAGPDRYLPIHTHAVRWLTYSTAVAAELAELHARSQLDLIVFPEWAAEGYVYLLNRTKWNHVPAVVHIHGPTAMFAHTMGWPEFDSELYRTGTAMEATCLRLADAVSSSSACSTEWCAKHYGLERDFVPTLHTGVDTRTFFPREVAKAERPTVIFVGNIVRNKGVDLLLDACCILAREFDGLRLRLIGRGDDALCGELRDLVKASGFPDLLELPGYVARAELPNELSQAHVFAGPSIYEGGPGNVYLEAMACALPTIACSGSGVSELLIDRETALLVPPNDRDALTNALRELLARPERRSAMGARARQKILSEADSELCLDRLEQFYAAVAGQIVAAQALCA
jgi:glycosyltransferase involved in cell wall biosynthesis